MNSVNQISNGRTKKFNFNQLHVFLTYPHCDLRPADYLAIMQAKQEVAQYVISSEKHQDGTPHLHALLSFATKFHSTDSRCFDVLGCHPNIQKASSKADRARIKTYIEKDGDFITNIEIQLGKRAALFSELIEEGQITRDFVRRNPEIMHESFTNLKNWMNFLSPPVVVTVQLPKKRHLWITGPANCGKSYYLRAYLQLFNNPREIPTNDDYAHCDQDTDVLWIDEYRGQLTVQALNRLCDGNARLNTKGGATHIAYPLVIVVSNYQMREVYPKISDGIYNTLLARFTMYDPSVKYPPFPSCEL